MKNKPLCVETLTPEQLQEAVCDWLFKKSLVPGGTYFVTLGATIQSLQLVSLTATVYPPLPATEVSQ